MNVVLPDLPISDTEAQLESFLRGELSAVESYRLALAHLDDFAHRDVLVDCERSHARRAQSLAKEALRRGMEVPKTSGLWGAVAKVVEAAAARIGERAAIAALAQGEDLGRESYVGEVDVLDDAARELVKDELLPEQLRTQRAIHELGARLSES